MSALHLKIEGRVHGRVPFLAPVPFDGLGRRFEALEAEGARVVDRLVATSGQAAYLIRPESDVVVLDYAFREDPDASVPDWLWRRSSDRLSRASPELATFARTIAMPTPSETIQRIADHVVTQFHYGAGTGRFTDGEESVPLVCDYTRGTCIDIHTYFCAALRAGGIEAAYVAGIFIRDGTDEATDMHCWVAIRCGDLVEEWDLSHALIAKRKAGAGLTEIPGRRVALSAGRALRFTIDGEPFELSHLALPSDRHGGVLQTRATLASR